MVLHLVWRPLFPMPWLHLMEERLVPGCHLRPEVPWSVTPTVPWSVTD